MSSVNTALRDLQATLVKQHNKLNSELDNVTKPEVAKTISREMQEITHRITMIGRLLFAQQTKQLQTKVDAVKTATGKLSKAIQDLKNSAQFLDAMTDFLTLVDDAIDFAKTLA